MHDGLLTGQTNPARPIFVGSGLARLIHAHQRELVARGIPKADPVALPLSQLRSAGSENAAIGKRRRPPSLRS